MNYPRVIVEAALGWVAARAARRLVARDVAVAKRQRRGAPGSASDTELHRLEAALRDAWRYEGAAELRLEKTITDPEDSRT